MLKKIVRNFYFCVLSYRRKDIIRAIATLHTAAWNSIYISNLTLELDGLRG